MWEFDYRDIGEGVEQVYLRAPRGRAPVGFVFELVTGGFGFSTTPRIAALLPDLKFVESGIPREDATKQPDLYITSAHKLGSREVVREHMSAAFQGVDWKVLRLAIRELFQDIKRIEADFDYPATLEPEA